MKIIKKKSQRNRKKAEERESGTGMRETGKLATFFCQLAQLVVVVVYY